MLLNVFFVFDCYSAHIAVFVTTLCKLCHFAMYLEVCHVICHVVRVLDVHIVTPSMCRRSLNQLLWNMFQYAV